MTVKVRDLRPLHSPKVSGVRKSLEQLTDRELLAAIHQPANGDFIKIDKKSGKVVDGNGRAYELLRRAVDPASSVTMETEIDVELYERDNSAFPDL